MHDSMHFYRRMQVSVFIFLSFVFCFCYWAVALLFIVQFTLLQMYNMYYSNTQKNRIWVLSRVSDSTHLVERKRNNVVIYLIFYSEFFLFGVRFSHFLFRFAGIRLICWPFSVLLRFCATAKGI